jgi:hypothetical protein
MIQLSRYYDSDVPYFEYFTRGQTVPELDVEEQTEHASHANTVSTKKNAENVVFGFRFSIRF